MEKFNCEKPEEIDDDFMLDDFEEEDPFSQSIQQWMNMESWKSDALHGYNISPSYWYNSVAPRVIDPSPEDIAKLFDHTRLKAIGIEDVVKEHALPLLPAKLLCKFRTVSKQWNQWINNPFFSHKQTVHYRNVSGLFCQVPDRSPSFISLDPTAFGVPSTSLSFLPEPVDIRSSCNGLLCCQGRHGDQPYYICNPVTKDLRKLPLPKLYHGPGTAIALAFEPSLLNFAANYELICVVHWPHLPVLFFEIYSSRTGSWRTSETLCCDEDAVQLNGDGFYMKGTAYWKTQSGAVLAFNVFYEYFGIITLPPCSGPTGAITVIQGDLCYLLPQVNTIEVYGDMNMNLKQVIALCPEAVDNMEGVLKVLSFVNDDILILDLGGTIIAYHIKSHKVERLLTNATGFSKYLPYVNNLVSLAQPVASEWD